MNYSEFLDALRALAEPTRLRLIALLAESELTVSEMVEILGQSQPRLSRHLKLLSDAGLLDRSPEGVHVYFRLGSDAAAGKLARGLLESLEADDPVRLLDRQRLSAIQRSRAVSAETYFRRHAADWDAIRSLHIPEAEVERAILKLLPRRKVQDLLDLGTGTGRMLQLCASHVERAVGVDLSREMLAVARANLDGQDYRNCSLRRAPAEHLPFGNGSFDVVLSHMVLHFLDNPELAIQEAARVLKPRGRLILVDFAPHDATVLGPGHAHRWPGFADERINGWIEEAGLVAGRPVSLPAPSGLSQRPLTVKLWRGERPEPAESHQPAVRAEPNLELFQ
jgi:ArsR family transcriptional regulator